MIETAYTTTIGKMQKLPGVENFIMSSLLNRDDFLIAIAPNVYKIAPIITPSECAPFKLPFVCYFKNEPVVVVDTRTYERPNGNIVQSWEYKDIITRGLLEYAWVDDNDKFKPTSDVISYTFASWIIQTISSRYNATLIQQEIMRIWLMAYYELLFYSDEELADIKTDDLVYYLSKKLIQVGRLSGSFVSDVVKSTTFINYLDRRKLQLNNMLGAMSDYIDSPSLRFDVGAIIVLVASNSWFGYASKELSAAAIEHPPILAYMINKCLGNGTYRKTKVGMAAEAARRNKLDLDSIVKLQAMVTRDIIIKDDISEH